MDRGPLLIVGASGRCAADWAVRSGYRPTILDLFADADTQKLGPTSALALDHYPHGFIELARTVPPMPWMYTGGLENDPDVVAAISETHTLLGNGPEVLRRVRDPFCLADVCRHDGIPFPDTRRSRHPGDSDVRCLRKSFRSSAGMGVRDDDEQPLRDDEYIQEFVTGEPGSLLFESDGNHRASFLGKTRQLIGESWLHARPYAYCGNLLQPADDRQSEFLALGNTLSRVFQLTGPWGIDGIEQADRWTLLEINPRITAAWDLFQPPRHAGQLIGKAVYFAPRTFTVPRNNPWTMHQQPTRPDYADLPHAGSTIEAGQPVITILGEGDCESEILAQLKLRARELDQLVNESRNIP